MKPLFVYGTLRPGQSNAHILENIGGEWQPGYITGTYYASGAGPATGFPGIIAAEHGSRIEGSLFISPQLENHWPMLDDFEEVYDRITVQVTTTEGNKMSAWVYQLQPRSLPATESGSH